MTRHDFALLRSALRFGAEPLPLVIGTLAAWGNIAAQLALPWLIGLIIDETLVEGGGELLLARCALLALIAVVMVLLRQARVLAFTWLGGRAVVKLRTEMLGHLHRLPIGYFDRHKSGTTQALFTHDAPTMGTLYNPIVGDAIHSLSELLALVTLVGVRYGGMIWVAAALIPVYVLLPALLARRTGAAARRLQEARAEVSAGIQETIGAVREIKAFTAEDWNARRQDGPLRAVLRRVMGLTAVRSVYSLSFALYWIAIGFLYWFGGRQVLAGEITLGALIALVTYLGLLDGPSSRLVGLHAETQTALSAAARVQDFLALPEERDGEQAPAVAASRPDAVDVEFERVTFRYAEGSHPALADLSFRVEAAQRAAIVGPSGAGKSTLIALLMRLYEPERGTILVARTPLDRWPLAALRRTVGAVFQEPLLLGISIGDNIRLGRIDATDQEVTEAARLANAHQFIASLPDGYATELGERGVGLSVGQRQRIAIARALLRDPPILVLDEATSALDAESERLVQEALDRLMAGRTCFTVAHRLASVARADTILVLDRGSLAGQGTHRELQEGCPLYRRLLQLQLATEANADVESGRSSHVRLPELAGGSQAV